jgi:SAM-dependent methyltransferase
LHLHNIEELPFPLKKSQFDAVISNGVFHLVYPLKAVFAEVQRILKAGGLFVFTYENTDDIFDIN